jgi:hypothetical protein
MFKHKAVCEECGDFYEGNDKKEYIHFIETHRCADSVAVSDDSKGALNIIVDGTGIKVEWEAFDAIMSIDYHWPKERDNDFKFIAKAEIPVVEAVKKASGLNFKISGGSGTIGYRFISGAISI